MFVLVVLLFLWSGSSAEVDKVSYRCSNRTDKSFTTFTPTGDGVPGRYTAELCTVNDPRVSEWNIDVSTYDDISQCNGHGRLRRPDHLHSNNYLNITDPTNCSHICYSTSFDLVYTACYGIKSTFKIGSVIGPPHDSFHMINNNITKDHILLNKPHVSPFNHENYVSLYWYLGIPPASYRVYIYCNETEGCPFKGEVTHNCTSRRASPEVECKLSPPYACYRALLRHEAPWTAGVFNTKSLVHFDFCHVVAAAPQVGVGVGGVWWALGLALACAGALAALLLRRALHNDTHKHLLASWTNRGVEAAPPRSITPAAVGPEGGAGPGPDRRPVLLLYAREGEHAQNAITALKNLVQTATQGQVWDIMSAEVMCLAAGSPAAWLREVLWRQDVRVLLVQTPATAALYRAQLSQNTTAPTLVEPLLGRRAVYRVPVFGDTLVQLALRLVAEAPHTHHHYHKYYLAHVCGLETEILSQVVPYRRYSLPAAAPALCRDLCAAPPPAAPLTALHDAITRLRDHVTHNPDYLMDELVIL